MNFAIQLSTWTDPRVELLSKLHATNELSFSEMAQEINDQTGSQFTRNAVIGKALRIGLPMRQRGNHPNKHKDMIRRCKPRGPRLRRQLGEIVPIVESIPHEQRRSLLELNAHTCRYPIGDPQDEDFFFCGAEPAEGLPYCAGHYFRCYTPSKYGRSA